MAYMRFMTIAPKSFESDIASQLKGSFTAKTIHEMSGHVLIAYEGRSIPKLNAKKTLTLGIDGRNAGYYCEGDQKLAEIFNARIELVIGIAINLTGKDRVTAPAKKLFKKLEKLCTDQEDNEDDDRYSLRFDVSIEGSPELIRLINELGMLLKKEKIPYRAATFDGIHGQEAGDLSDSGLYIGPAAYAFANWDQEVLRTENIELTLNGTEALLDGNSIPGLS